MYDGGERLGDIVIRNGQIVARTAAGKRLGVFDDERQAMRAIYSAARPEREAHAESGVQSSEARTL